MSDWMGRRWKSFRDIVTNGIRCLIEESAFTSPEFIPGYDECSGKLNKSCDTLQKGLSVQETALAGMGIDFIRRGITAVLLIILMAGINISRTHAQLGNAGTPPDTNGVTHSVLPALSYESDLGLIGGGFYVRTLRRPNYDPYKDRFRAAALASTKGYLEGNIQYTWLKSFGTDIRSRLDLYAHRLLQDYYFGIGNSSSYSEDLWDEEYYFFRSVSFGVDYKGRKPLREYEGSGNNHLDLLLLAGVQYEIPYVRQDSSSFNFMPPPGDKGGWLNYIGTGILWDTRNTEVAPKRGIRFQAEVEYAPELLLSDFEMGLFKGDFRHYFTFHLLRDVTVANRLLVRHTTGEVPYWRMSTFGDADRMRGYPRNRFMGKSMVTHSLELRTWLLKWPEYKVKLGGQLFMDTGRVFSENDQSQAILENYKQSFGFGGAFTLFDPDFLFRADIGFAKEGAQLYVGTRYAF